MTSPERPITHTLIIRLTIPIILANMAVPILGLVDTAVIGHTGDASDLGAIALGSMVFNFVYWAFGFLRMGTTSFTAQAAGAGNCGEARAAYCRALMLGAAIGCILLLFQYPLITGTLWLLDGSDQVEADVKTYWDIRIWAAPATLATYAVMGTLIGLGKTRQLLALQLCLNGINFVLDVVFVVGLDWGVSGIAAGTVIAEWTCALVGLWMVNHHLRESGKPFWNWRALFDRTALGKILTVNADIMWRTLFLLSGFAFFTNQSAQFGDSVLAANHLLLQFISFSAFFLDGFAFAVESLVGKATGARDRNRFDQVVQISTQLAAITAFGLMVLIYLAGKIVIANLTSIVTVQQAAVTYLPYAAVYVLVSFAAFQLDGIFIGGMQSRAMRNASFFSLIIFLLVYFSCVEFVAEQLTTPIPGNHMLWAAFIIYVIARAGTLGYYYPRLRNSITQANR